MAIVLPSATGYHRRIVDADVVPGSPTYAQHVRDAVENQHWLLAKRGRWLVPTVDYTKWDGALDYLRQSGAGYLVLGEQCFESGFLSNTAIDPRFFVRARASAGQSGTVRFEVFDKNGASQGTTDITVTGATVTWYTGLWSAANALLNDQTPWRVEVSEDKGTATQIDVYEWGVVEDEGTSTAYLP